MRYVRPPNIISHLYEDSSTAKSCNVADINNKSSLNDVFFEDDDVSVRNSVRYYWARNQQVDLMDIAFKEESLLSIQKKSRKKTVTARQRVWYDYAS